MIREPQPVTTPTEQDGSAKEGAQPAAARSQQEFELDLWRKACIALGVLVLLQFFLIFCQSCLKPVECRVLLVHDPKTITVR